MASRMANMVKATHQKSRGNSSNLVSTKRKPKQTAQKAQASNDMGLGGIIGLGAKAVIGVGLLGGLAGSMGGGGGVDLNPCTDGCGGNPH